MRPLLAAGVAVFALLQFAGSANTIILNAEWYSLVAPSNPATVIATVTGGAGFGLVLGTRRLAYRIGDDRARHWLSDGAEVKLAWQF